MPFWIQPKTQPPRVRVSGTDSRGQIPAGAPPEGGLPVRRRSTCSTVQGARDGVRPGHRWGNIPCPRVTTGRLGGRRTGRRSFWEWIRRSPSGDRRPAE